jgi:flagellar hook-associated protein 2
MGGFGVSLNTTGLGLGSGIDVQATVSQLVQAAEAPEQAMVQEQQLFTSQASALNNLNSLLSSLQTAVEALQGPDGQLNAEATTSSDPTVVTATANPGATLGTHSITVSQLATVSSYYTGDLASADTTFATGQFTVKVGTGTPVTITVDNTDNTLNGLATYINNNSQSLGVTANVISDASGSRLSLLSNTSGAPGDLQISGNTTGLSFTKAVTGTNASFTLDGVPLSSSTNSVTTAIPGVTLSLVGTSSSPVSVSITPDANQATAAVNSFVSAYNAVVQAINTQFTYTQGGTQPPLFSDNTLAQVQQTLANDVNYAIPGSSGPTSLATFGVSVQQDGTLSVDTGTLTSALTGNFSAVQSFLQSTTNGFATNFSNDLTNLTDPTTGALYVDLQGINQNQNSVTQQINDFQANIAQQQQAWTQEFGQVNATLQTLPLLVAQIDSELGLTSSSSTGGIA